MEIHKSQSKTYLRQDTAKLLDRDFYNGSASRDFYDSFWGTGDVGPSVLFARMQGAAKTTDELKNFWVERAKIEEEYASRMAKLARAPIGGDETSGLRSCLKTLRLETEKQAESHLELAGQLRRGFEHETAQFHVRQIKHLRIEQASLENKFKMKQTKEASVAKAREEYETGCARNQFLTQQATLMQGQDLKRVTQKRQREEQKILTLERALEGHTNTLLDLQSAWEADWKEFCDTCQDLEEDRIESMKEILWAYANAISEVCVTDDVSCESLRTALEQLEPERDGSADYTPGLRQVGINDAVQQTSQPKETSLPSPQNTETSSQLRSLDNSPYSQRPVRSRPPTSPPHSPPPPVPPQSYLPPLQSAAPPTPSRVIPTPPAAVPPSSSPTTTSPVVLDPRSRGKATPQLSPKQQPTSTKPVIVEQLRNPSPPPDGSTIQVLFYVQALFDYTATTEEEFDFQTGDVIAVTATPEDGWWSGELLDEARRREGAYIFPSNFVRLF